MQPLRHTLLHLRIPFSWHLAPVSLFALSQVQDIVLVPALSILAIQLFFLYPASHGFNSYYDRDEEAIGELEHPPPVSPLLLRVSLILDGCALIWAFQLGAVVGVLVLAYGLASKAYSHPTVRLKSRPYLGWSVVVIFQGGITFLMTYLAASQSSLSVVSHFHVSGPALLSSLIIGAGYPLSQVFQHGEDGRRGDRTLSLILGVRGTFIFSAIGFALVQVVASWVFLAQGKWSSFLIFQAALVPSLLLFFEWARRCWKDPVHANFRSSRRLNRAGSSGLNLAFLLMKFVG